MLLDYFQVKRKDNSVSDTVFAWGEYQQCQLSTGNSMRLYILSLMILADIRNFTKPQPMRWVMKFLQRYEYTPIDISCGGYHNLLLYAPVRQVAEVCIFGFIVRRLSHGVVVNMGNLGMDMLGIIPNHRSFQMSKM